LEIRARHLIAAPHRRQWLDALAEALLTRETIPGADAEQIIRIAATTQWSGKMNA